MIKKYFKKPSLTQQKRNFNFFAFEAQYNS